MKTASAKVGYQVWEILSTREWLLLKNLWNKRSLTTSSRQILFLAGARRKGYQLSRTGSGSKSSSCCSRSRKSMIDKLNLSSEAPNWAGSSRPRRTTTWLLVKIRWPMSLTWEALKWLSTPSHSSQRQMVIWPTQKPTACRQLTSEIIKTAVKTRNPLTFRKCWKYSLRPRHRRYDKSRAWETH